MISQSDTLRNIRQIEIRARKVVNSLFSGEYHSIFKGMGMSFSESRPYQPGDDIRAMDWKVTARQGKPFVKVYHEERELSLMLLVDLSASGDFGSCRDFKSQIAAQVCATLAFSAIRNSDKVGLIAFTDKVELYIAPKKGRKHVLRLVKEILTFQPEGKGTDIKAPLEYLNKVAVKNSIVFLVSDFIANGYERQLKATASRHDLVAIQLQDPCELTLPDAGLVTIRDAETGEIMTVDTSDARLREEYKATAMKKRESMKKMFYGAGADLVVVDTDRSYVEPLIRFFKLREKRRRFG